MKIDPMHPYFPVYSYEDNIGTTTCGCQICKINTSLGYECRYRFDASLKEVCILEKK